MQQPAPFSRGGVGVGAGARAHVCEMDLFHSISHGGRGGRADRRTDGRRRRQPLCTAVGYTTSRSRDAAAAAAVAAVKAS